MDKFYSIVEHVDRTTGEILTESEYKRNYVKFNTSINYENNGRYTVRKVTIECERDRQQKFEW